MAEKPSSVSHHEKSDQAFSNVFDHKDEEVPTPPNQDWTREEERALVLVLSVHTVRLPRLTIIYSKKLDWRVFPMLCVVFGLSLLDRTNISAAYIAGMAVDLELTVGARYSIALLVFFIG